MLSYFNKKEKVLWCVSVLLIVISFCVFDRNNYLVLLASIVGVTSLIFNAKGNPFGQLLMILFSFLYGIISFSFSYYGEMFTYLGMTMPMAVFSFVSWLKNPYSSREVKVNCLKVKEMGLMVVLTIVVTIIFYYILLYFNTSNIVFSTISVSTSFVAVYLTFRRSKYYALAYALNDFVLIVLWLLASFIDVSYLTVVICFIVFFVNDVYGFVCWSKMEKKQMRNIG